MTMIRDNAYGKDYDKNQRHEYLDLDELEDFCELTDDEKSAFLAEHEKLAEFEERLASYCELV